MTSEKRILIAPQDILKLGFECPHCAAIYTVPIDKLDRDRIISTCPNCHEAWASDEQPSSENVISDVKIVRSFLDCLQKIRNRKFGQYMRFEITDMVQQDKV